MAKTRQRSATKPALTAPPPPPPAATCTEIARRTGQQCKQKPTVYGDRCRSHPRAPVNAITAASTKMSINGVGWKTWRFGDQAWQLEAWRMYDIIGELRKYANMIGAQVSRCRLYVAEVDENGEAIKEVEDPDIAQLAAGPLGKGPAKDEALRLLGVNLSVVGEAYIVAESKGGEKGKDLWYVVSGSEISQQGNSLTITRPAMWGLGGELQFRDGEDLLIRCWTPHPRRTMWADSSVRSAIPVLRKIETTMKRSFAELDSRLTGAGALLFPQGVDFPRGDGVPEGIDGLAQTFMRIAATSIEDRASSDAMVPLLLTLPADTIEHVKFLTFWSELSGELQGMEDAAIRRLAVDLDIPPEALTGIGGTNHWTAWAVEEATIKTFIEPVLARIAEALDHGYLDAALEFMGLDPEKYTYAFDTSPLAVKPDRTATAKEFNDAGLLSDEATRRAANYPEEDAPTPEERVRNLLEQALPTKPELLDNPVVRKLLGLDEAAFKALGATPITPQEAGTSNAAPVSEQDELPPANSGRPGENTPRQAPPAPVNGQAASAALWTLANYAVTRALGVAGTRLIPHTQRDRWPGVFKHDLYVRYGAVTRERAEKVLAGTMGDLRAALANDPQVKVDPVQAERLLHGFCVELLTHGVAYEPQMLHTMLNVAARQLTPPVPVGAL